ncbi:MAG: glycoside hydrolase family 28 protein [Terriglobales bacterium]
MSELTDKMKNRRQFLKASLGAGGGVMLAGAVWSRDSGTNPLSSFSSDLADATDPWAGINGILARIKPPAFPNRDFEISNYGAVGDNRTDCTDAFTEAIAACQASGGGRVLVTPGQYISGAITLKSNVNLHIAQGATIHFSRDSKKYPLVFTRWEGTELMNYSPFIYAFEQENIAITGKGTIDGNCDCEHWWPWKGRTNCGWKPGDVSQEKDRNQLFAMAERGVPVSERVFGEGHYLRPQFIQPYRCKNVLIEDVTLFNSPMWQVHPVLCTNVTVRGLNISSYGPNTDGCDPESCTDVLIENCFFNTGDDCVAIKSGRNADGRRLGTPSQSIVIRHCRMKDGHGGVTVGSEISGGVRNVFAEHCQMDSPHLDIAVRIKNNAMRGGIIENIFARNIDIGEVATAAFSVDFFYEEGEAGKFVPVARNLEVRNLKARKAQYALYLRGFKNAPIDGVRVVDCDFNGVSKPDVIENVTGLSLHNVKENGKLIARVQTAIRVGSPA